MQLWYAPTSPFARKVRVAAAELGFADRITLVQVNPWTDGRLRALNPLGKVPTLVTDDEQAIYESGVICDWLDASAGRRGLFPSEGADRWRALMLQGLADGAMTAAGRLFADEKRPQDQRSAAMMARLAEAVQSPLSALERDPPSGGAVTIGEISAACLLGYLDFRWPDRNWRAGHPRLATWFAAMDSRPSMASTRHHS